MKCPICESNTRVKETRESPTFGIRRRRVCEENHWFTTQETVIPKDVLDAERLAHQENFMRGVVALRESKRAVVGTAQPGFIETE